MAGLEVCANSFASAVAAQEGGAIRVELCDNLADGGTTPSYGQIAQCKAALHIQIYPIIRPRGGDFLYNDADFEIMKRDIETCKTLHCDGIVFGLLTAEGNIDKARNAELIALAAPMKATFHRAFDMVADPEKALEDIIDLGFERILTSGGADKAMNGLENIKNWISQAGERIIIMPGSGINPTNITEIATFTGAKEFHSTAKTTIQSQMIFRNRSAKMGGATDEFTLEQTDPAIVRELVSIINTLTA